MKNLIEAQIYLEEKINRLRAIHYLISKPELSKYKEDTTLLNLVKRFTENNWQLKFFRLQLAFICEDIITINALRTLAAEFEVPKYYKMNKIALISSLKGVRIV